MRHAPKMLQQERVGHVEQPLAADAVVGAKVSNPSRRQP